MFSRGDITLDLSLPEGVSAMRAAGYSEQLLLLVQEIHAFIDEKGIAGANRQQIKVRLGVFCTRYIFNYYITLL